MRYKFLSRSVSFEHNGTSYLVEFRWSFFRGITGGKVWVEQADLCPCGGHLLKYIGPISGGTENLRERLKYWIMVVKLNVKHRLQAFQSRQQLQRRVNRALRVNRRT